MILIPVNNRPSLYLVSLLASIVILESVSLEDANVSWSNIKNLNTNRGTTYTPLISYF
jgi:hypothetical protein